MRNDANIQTRGWWDGETRRRTCRGFTLIELLVVVGIILILASLIMTATAAANRQKLRVLALSQVKDIAAAAQRYFEQFGSFPPDTDGFPGADTTADPVAIHRYLGSKLKNASGRECGPFLEIPDKFLKGPVVTVDSCTYQRFCDPWGNPYLVDAMHVNVDNATGTVTRFGEPYNSLMSDEQRKTLEIKIWSKGPDGRQQLGSQALDGKGSGDDADNITSWAD